MTYWLIQSLVISAIASIAIWSRRPTAARGLAVVAFLASMPITGAAMLRQAGWPVEPIHYLAEIPDDATVSGVSLVPNVAIFIMVDIDGEPRLFRLPWNAEQANKVQRMLEKGNGGNLKARKGHGPEVPVELYEPPQPPTPEKQPEASGMQYQRTEP